MSHDPFAASSKASPFARVAAGIATLLVALTIGRPLAAQVGYAVEIATQTDANVTSLDAQTAINDAGWIACTGVAAGRSTIFVIDPANARQVVSTAATNTTYAGAAIDNNSPPQLAVRSLIAGPSYAIRRWSLAGGFVNIGISPGDFDSATSYVHLNDSGVVAFPGLTQGSSRLVLFAGSARPPANLAEFPFAFAFRPQIADDGRILVRRPTGEIVTYAPAADIALPPTWTLTGNMPGISRDGRAVGFIGNRGMGKALYLSYRDTAGWNLLPVVGENATGPFTDFADGVRVGVTSSGDAATTQRISLVYYALAQGVWGVWSTDVTIQTTGGVRSTVVSRPSAVVKVGDVIGGLTITSLNLVHPINRDGDVACWFAHAAGSGVLRARRKVRVDRENMRLKSATAVANGASRWRLTLEMDNDNADDNLQNTEPDWRRWWHCEVEVFDTTAGETLDVDVTNAGYADVFVPAWSLSTDGGQTFPPYVRIPAANISGQTYTSATATHHMQLVTPPGVTHLRLAKFLPYSVADKDAWLGSLNHPRLTIGTLPLASEEGRPIHMLEITDRTMPAEGKRRVWIHSGTHPGETTSYFTLEGLVGYLLSGSPAVEGLLDKVIFDIVPMQNPDGVFHGNYRTNARSQNLEEQWRRADAQKSAEVLAIKRQIELFMGTAQAPGVAPIVVLLNLHSAHNVAWPFHFEHVANPNAGPTDPNGVRPAVAVLESIWVSTFKAASAFVNRGTSQSSNASRAVIEGWVHDAYTVNGAWSPVMAITFEGTYLKGPDGVNLVTAADYRALGAEMGRALLAYFGRGTITAWGRVCEGAVLSATIGSGRLAATVAGVAPATAGVFAVGTQRFDIPLPWPSICSLGVFPDISLSFSSDNSGRWLLDVPLPPVFCAAMQAIVLEPRGQLRLVSSNGLTGFYRR